MFVRFNIVEKAQSTFKARYFDFTFFNYYYI